MPLPILSYGHEMLKQPCNQIADDYPALDLLIGDMWETMYHADGCGLAAPQVGHGIRLFMIDSRQSFGEMNAESRLVYFEDNKGIKQAFINPQIIERSDRTWKKEEACLSMPGLQGEVVRPWSVTITYVDEQFHFHTLRTSGITARMIQHEYDHINGVLFTDLLRPMKRRFMRSQLKRISKGKVSTVYPMQFV